MDETKNYLVIYAGSHVLLKVLLNYLGLRIEGV